MLGKVYIFSKFEHLLLAREIITFQYVSFERFSLYIQEKEESELRPVYTEDGITYIYIKVIVTQSYYHILFFNDDI